MSYGPEPILPFKHMAHQIDQILRGQPVSEVPYYQTAKWEFVVNRKTASALDLEFPPTVLARADDVME